MGSLENVGYGKPLFVPLACNCHVPEGNLKPCPLHGPQRSPRRAWLEEWARSNGCEQQARTVLQSFLEGNPVAK